MDARQGAAPTAFISYAHEDGAVAHEIKAGLEEFGCDVKIDQNTLRTGYSLAERLAAAVVSVDFVIAIVSVASLKSHWCRKEISLAMSHELELGQFEVRRVLPLRLGDVEMPPMLGDKVYLGIDESNPRAAAAELWRDMIGAEVEELQPPGRPAPTPSDASYELGMTLYRKGEVAAARRHLHDASQEGHHGAALLLGEILCDQERYEEAAGEWQFAAGSSDPEIAGPAVIHYGRLLAGQEFASGGKLSGSRGPLLGGRSLAEAEALWRRAAESGHRDAVWAWLGLGRLLEDPGERGAEPDLQGAVEAFDRAARAGHGESGTYALFKLGRLKFKRGESEEAVSVLNIGATRGDRDWSPWCAFELGRVHWSREEDEEAFRWWHEAAAAGHPRISESAQEALNDPNSIWRRRWRDS